MLPPDELPVLNPSEAVDPILVGDKIVLRPMLPEDYSFFHAIEHTASPLGLSRLGGRTLPIEKYVESIWTNVIVALTFVDKASGMPAGYGLCYDADFESSRGRIALLTVPQVRGTARSLEGLQLVLSYLFEFFPFRALYADVMDPNLEQFMSAERDGLMVREGHFPEYSFWRGSYVGLSTFKISRAAHERWAARLAAASLNRQKTNGGNLTGSSIVSAAIREVCPRVNLDDSAVELVELQLDSIEWAEISVIIEENLSQEGGLPFHELGTLGDLQMYVERLLRKA